jgi:hypothetical protein
MLSDAFKDHDEPAEPKEPVEPVAAKPTDAPELVKVGDRYHNKDGTFASKEAIDAFNAGAAPEVPALPNWADRLTPVEQQQFTSLPAETRAFLERTMEGVNNSAALFNEYSTIEQVIGPRRGPWAANGMPPAVAIQQVLALSDFAGRDPGQFVLWFADQHKLNLDVLLDQRDQRSNQPPDPRYDGLLQEITQLRNSINGMTSQATGQQYANNLALVQTFIDEKDASGNLMHPHFNEVAPQIEQHIAALKQQQPYLDDREVLNAAYDFATYSNLAVRTRIQESSAQALKDKAAAEAAKARAAGASINGGPAGDAGRKPNNANRTLIDELSAAYDASVAN